MPLKADGLSYAAYQKMAANYVNEVPGVISKMRDALREKDYETYAKNASLLKAQTLKIGATPLSKKAGFLEKCAEVGQEQGLMKHSEQFLEEFEGLVEKLNVVIHE